MATQTAPAPTALWAKLDPENKGHVPKETAMWFFSRSKVPTATLESLWNTHVGFGATAISTTQFTPMFSAVKTAAKSGSTTSSPPVNEHSWNALSDSERQTYTGYFRKLDVDNDGIINRTEAASLFNHSGLPETTLSALVALVTGVTDYVPLSLNQFVVAMALIKGVRKGAPTPPTLPPVLSSELNRAAPPPPPTAGGFAVSFDSPAAPAFTPPVPQKQESSASMNGFNASSSFPPDVSNNTSQGWASFDTPPPATVGTGATLAPPSTTTNGFDGFSQPQGDANGFSVSFPASFDSSAPTPLGSSTTPAFSTDFSSFTVEQATSTATTAPASATAPAPGTLGVTEVTKHRRKNSFPMFAPDDFATAQIVPDASPPLKKSPMVSPVDSNAPTPVKDGKQPAGTNSIAAASASVAAASSSKAGGTSASGSSVPSVTALDTSMPNGFELAKRKPAAENSATKNWQTVLSEGLPKSLKASEKKIFAMARAGIPQGIRGDVWAAAVDASSAAARQTGEGMPALIAGKSSVMCTTSVARQVTNALSKGSIVNNDWLGKGKDSAWKAQIWNILKAYTEKQPGFPWEDELVFLASALLTVYVPRQAFVVFTGLMDSDKTGLKLCYKPGAPLLGQWTYQLEGLLKQQNKAVLKLLESNSIGVKEVATPWLRSLFASVIPWPLAVRVWDVYLVEGPKILFRVALYLLAALKKPLSKAGSSSTAKILVNNPMGPAKLRGMDPDAFMKAILKVKITRAKLHVLELDYDRSRA